MIQTMNIHEARHKLAVLKSKLRGIVAAFESEDGPACCAASGTPIEQHPETCPYRLAKEAGDV